MERRFFETCFFFGVPSGTDNFDMHWLNIEAHDLFLNTCHMCIVGMCLFSYKEID